MNWFVDGWGAEAGARWRGEEERGRAWQLLPCSYNISKAISIQLALFLAAISDMDSCQTTDKPRATNSTLPLRPFGPVWGLIAGWRYESLLDEKHQISLDFEATCEMKPFGLKTFECHLPSLQLGLSWPLDPTDGTSNYPKIHCTCNKSKHRLRITLWNVSVVFQLSSAVNGRTAKWKAIRNWTEGSFQFSISEVLFGLVV